MRRHALEYGATAGWVWLRELSGRDEESVAAADTENALSLLDRLLVDRPGALVGAGRAEELTVADRDCLLAAVYLAELGSRVESTALCAACRQPYDLDFQLEDILAQAHEPPPTSITREAGGVFRLPDGRRFRLPCGTDERAATAAATPEQMPLELLRRCTIEDSAADDPEGITEAMRAAGPLLDLELDAPCPECGHAQEVRFDLQHYLLTRILDERGQRAREVHRLARTYGWSLSEILDLPRGRRRLLAELIDRDRLVR